MKRLCVTPPLKDVDRTSPLYFSSSANQSEAAKQRIHTTKSFLPGILMLYEERNSDGLCSGTWVSGWEYPLQRPLERAITPGTPTTAPRTTLMDERSVEMSRDLEGAASGPETSILFLRLRSGRFDRVDSGA